jgi:hypothetical protein
MSQTNFTPIQLYYSITASAAPTAGNLANGELAINITDGKLFYKDNGGAVQVLATKGAGTIGGSNTQVQYNSSGALAGSANLTFDGTTLTANALTTTSTVTINGGTANGVAYLNGSKVLTTGSALTFDGSKLLVSSSGEQLKLLSSGDFTTTGTGYIRWYDSVGAKGYIGYAGTANQFDLQTGAGMNLNFNAVGGTTTWQISNAEQMRLTSTGLGIGTSSAVYKLVVSNGGASGIEFGPAFSGTANLIQSYNRSGGAYVNTVYDANEHIFNTLGTQRLRLDSSGNLGLGVTPSAWGSARKALQVGQASIANSTAANDVFELSANRYLNSGSADTYIGNGYATAYQQGTGGHRWYTAPPGTAGNPITFTQAMTLDASGNLGLGTTSATAKLDVYNASNDVYMALRTGSAEMTFNTGTGFTGSTATSIWNKSAIPMVFGTNSAERARIDASGNLLVGTTSQIGAGKVCSVANINAGAFRTTATANSYTALYAGRDGNAGNAVEFWYSSATQVGSVSVSSVATLYNTTSDYRLKTVIGPVTNASQRIDALEPVEYEWKADGSRTRGFLAHKFQEVYAGSVSGAKDAVDADGKPVYQSMQAGSSEVIADLVAEIQSLRKRLAAAGI